VSLLWDMKGYPSWPGYLDFHRLSMIGMRIFRIDGRPYDAAAAARRAAERARDDERDLLRALMDSVPDPIVFKDRESRFTRVNAAAAAKSPKQLKKLFNEAGYGVNAFGKNKPRLKEIITAFQRHFEPEVFSDASKTPGVATEETVAILRAVARMNSAAQKKPDSGSTPAI